MQLRIMTCLLLAACSNPDVTTRQPPPVVHIHTAVELPDFDMGFCRRSMVPVQDPVFPTIRRDRFTVDADDNVQIPPDWIAEARDTRVPQLRRAAADRLPV